MPPVLRVSEGGESRCNNRWAGSLGPRAGLFWDDRSVSSIFWRCGRELDWEMGEALVARRLS